MAETQKEKLMRVLEISEEEAEAVMAYDKEVDHGKNPLPLTAEQEKIAKSYTKSSEHTKTATKTKRERKPNETKGEIIKNLFDFCQNFAENVQILNAERQISFQIGENSYELTLVQKRKK